MLTQEQARDLNIQQHELEDAELQQARAQQNVDKYYDAIQKVTSAMENATPEQREKISALLPQLTQGYEDAKNKKAYEEDRYRQTLNKINEYKELDVAQQSLNQGGQRRRVTHPTNTDTVTNQQTIVNNPFVGYQQAQQVPSINSQFVPNPDLLRMNGINVQTPALSQGYIIPQHIQEVRNAYGNDYLEGMKNLEKMGYTVFNQKAYDKYGNVYNLYH